MHSPKLTKNRCNILMEAAVFIPFLVYRMHIPIYHTDVYNCLSGYANVNDRKNDNIMMLFCRFAILISIGSQV